MEKINNDKVSELTMIQALNIPAAKNIIEQIEELTDKVEEGDTKAAAMAMNLIRELKIKYNYIYKMESDEQ